MFTWRRLALGLLVCAGVCSCALVSGCRGSRAPRAVQIYVVQRSGNELLPVAGAQVTLVPPASGEQFEGVTDASGAVLFENVPSGVRYAIVVVATGFENYLGQLPPDTIAVAGVVTQFVELTAAEQ